MERRAILVHKSVIPVRRSKLTKIDPLSAGPPDRPNPRTIPTAAGRISQGNITSSARAAKRCAAGIVPLWSARFDEPGAVRIGAR
jgi:hypothetical protein